MEFILILLAFAAVTGIAASSKGRSFGGWFVLGLLFSVFALIAVLVLPAIKPEDPYLRPRQSAGTGIRPTAPSTPTMSGAVPLRGTGTFDQMVAGTSRRQDVLENIASQNRARLYAVLRREPYNHHDPNAVAVDIDDRHVGYLPRADAEEFWADADYIGIGSDGAKVPAKLVGGTADAPTIGVQLDLQWPLERR
ncbi:HIRAN domain-containing protein [Gemmobacter nectariphilus]|uniref:HIRAN domain-containing protein n=1 Tax=Gemmobacter nectariphilus TaxID=220343 RepID=UPI0004287397|nr:HIRAN domain-containing protein [Gemmobacter nectariphilus]